MKNKREFHVTTEDITDGVPNDCYRCPLALCIERAGFHGVCVEYDVVEFNRGTKSLYFKLPRSVCKRLKILDSGKKIEPFSFTATIKRWNW